MNSHLYSPVIFLLFAALVCIVYAQENCGNVEVCLLKLSEGKHRFSLKITLDVAVTDLSKIDASGYFYNLNEDTNGILSGGSPSLSPNTVFSNTWEETTDEGNVQVGFPLIRASYSAMDVCVGVFEERYNTGDIMATETCRSVKMTKQTDIDFALIVDTTASMTDDIKDVRTNAQLILDQLVASSANFRGAVVTYNDRASSSLPDSRVKLDITENVDAVKNAIGLLAVEDVGGDRNECVYDGLFTALSLGWNFTNPRRRVTVVMGDAPGKVCSPDNISVQDVIDLTTDFPVVIDLSPCTGTSGCSSPSSRQASRQVIPTVTIKVPTKDRIPVTFIATQTTIVPEDFVRLAKGTGGSAVAIPIVADIASTIIDVIKGVDLMKIDPLSVKLQCGTDDEDKMNNFIVTNPNLVKVDYNIRELFTRTRMDRTANPGAINTFKLTRKERIALTIVWVDEEGVQKSAILRASACPLPS